MSETVITDELKALMNKEFGPEVYTIESWWLRKFAEAIDDPNPRWKEMTPLTFVTALQIEALEKAVMETECPLTRGLNGGNEIEYFQPMRLGDTITVTGRVTDMKEREGRLGNMLIILSELTCTNQRGEVAVKCRNTQIRY